MSKIYALSKILLMVVFLFFILEITTRVILWVITEKKVILKYGFDKNIFLKVLDLSELNIIVVDKNPLLLEHIHDWNSVKHDSKEKKERKLTEQKNYKDENKIKIWTFGGSSTHGYGCANRLASSWPKQLSILNDNFFIKNFGADGKNSDYAIAVLLDEIKKNKPNIILWATKHNIDEVIWKGLDRNKDLINYRFTETKKNNFLHFVDRIKKTFFYNLASYYIFDEFMFRVRHKINKIYPVIRSNAIPATLSYSRNEIDYKFAIKNFMINTEEAKNIAHEGNIEFYLVSLFTKYNEKEKSFYKEPIFQYYKKAVNELLRDEKIKFIDTEKNLEIIKKQNLFCDDVHQTLIGNKLTAKIIFENLVYSSLTLKKINTDSLN